MHARLSMEVNKTAKTVVQNYSVTSDTLCTKPFCGCMICSCRHIYTSVGTSLPVLCKSWWLLSPHGILDHQVPRHRPGCRSYCQTPLLTPLGWIITLEGWQNVLEPQRHVWTVPTKKGGPLFQGG